MAFCIPVGPMRFFIKHSVMTVFLVLPTWQTKLAHRLTRSPPTGFGAGAISLPGTIWNGYGSVGTAKWSSREFCTRRMLWKQSGGAWMALLFQTMGAVSSIVRFHPLAPCAGFDRWY